MASSAEAAAHSACAPAEGFVLPNVEDPAQYVNARYHGYQGDTTGETALQFSKGTTTLGFKFQGGVIVSVDSRSTQGSYIGAWLPGVGGSCSPAAAWAASRSPSRPTCAAHPTHASHAHRPARTPRTPACSLPERKKDH